MSLDLATVEKVSLLARLRLDENELKEMRQQMGNVLDYIQLLEQLKTDDVEPMVGAVELRNVFAEDVPQPSLSREAALANAPKKDDECFRVPAVLG